MKDLKTKPDITLESSSEINSSLDWVGMTEVELPILLENGTGTATQIFAKADLFVSLDDPKAKGIHMSRLYLKAKEFFAEQVMNFASLQELSELFIESHKEISENSAINLYFDYPLERKALISEQEGWRFYPSIFKLKNIQGKVESGFKTTITYSSTCPCSAALSRQINYLGFLDKFSGEENLSMKEIGDWLLTKESQKAVPHAQRSIAELEVNFREIPQNFIMTEWIDALENELATPVQAAVKREDEQEFARLNGSNMMFCEDAARKLKSLLDAKENIKTYEARVEHHESLHPHNAVAVVRSSLRAERSNPIQ